MFRFDHNFDSSANPQRSIALRPIFRGRKKKGQENRRRKRTARAIDDQNKMIRHSMLLSGFSGFIESRRYRNSSLLRVHLLLAMSRIKHIYIYIEESKTRETEASRTRVIEAFETRRRCETRADGEGEAEETFGLRYSTRGDRLQPLAGLVGPISPAAAGSQFRHVRSKRPLFGRGDRLVLLFSFRISEYGDARSRDAACEACTPCPPIDRGNRNRCSARITNLNARD